MNDSLLRPKPIAAYLTLYKLYQQQTPVLLTHLRIQLICTIICTIAVHFCLFQADHLLFIQIFYYLPFILWTTLVAFMLNKYPITDPHLINRPQKYRICWVKCTQTTLFLQLFNFITLIFIVLHLSSIYGYYFLPLDLISGTLNLRLLLQLRAMQNNLRNCYNSLYENKEYFLTEYQVKEMKEPFEEVGEEKIERYSTNQEIDNFMFGRTIKTHKTLRIKHSVSMKSNEEAAVYSQ